MHRVGNAQRLAAVCPDASSLGLGPGLPLADARARVPSLASFAHDPVADARLLRALSRLGHDFTPSLAIEPPDALLLEISGSAHLFGGPDRLAARLVARLERQGMLVRSGFGPTPDAALSLVRFPQAGGDIGKLPVAVLCLGEAAERGLRRAGLKRVEDLLRQPASTIAARFGKGALLALGRLTGEMPRPLRLRPFPARLHFEERLAEPLLCAEGARLVLQRLLARACIRLARRGRGARSLKAELFRTDGAVQALIVESGRPSRDPAALLRLFDERIETLADPLDPGFGYDRLRLLILRADPFDELQPGLAAGADGEAQALDDVIDRLAVRFGAHRLLRLAPADSHLPERSERRQIAQGSRPAPWRLRPENSTDPPDRPLFMFDPPEPIEVLAEVPDGPPHRFRWRRTQHRVTLVEGPERIAPEWWRLKSGALSGGRTRDYWRVEDADGRRFWLFRAGMYEEGKALPAWYLHGLFA